MRDDYHGSGETGYGEGSGGSDQEFISFDKIQVQFNHSYYERKIATKGHLPFYKNEKLVELYNIDADPTEKNEISDENLKIVNIMLKKLADYQVLNNFSRESTSFSGKMFFSKINFSTLAKFGEKLF